MSYTVSAVTEFDASRKPTSPAFCTAGVQGQASVALKGFEANFSGLVGNAVGAGASASFNVPLVRNRNTEFSMGVSGGTAIKMWLPTEEQNGTKYHDYNWDYSGDVHVGAAILNKDVLYDVTAGVAVGEKVIGTISFDHENGNTGAPSKGGSYRRKYWTPFIEGGATFKIEDSNPRNGHHYLRVGAGLDFSNSKPTETTPAGQPRAKDWKIDGTPNAFLKITWQPAVNRFGR